MALIIIPFIDSLYKYSSNCSLSHFLSSKITPVSSQVFDVDSAYFTATGSSLARNPTSFGLIQRDFLTLEVTIKCREMPQHIVSIEIPDNEREEVADEKRRRRRRRRRSKESTTFIY
ncbi:hypothetical protein RhiirB3_427530 [Rhizophagus irregularis]|nr:hypothetical protein RhiirB3_427530 [Rhizophagus irregularis]